MKNTHMSESQRRFLNARTQVQLAYPSAYALSVGDEGFVIAGAGQQLPPQITEVGAWMEYAQWLTDWPKRQNAASLHALAFDRDTQIELAKQLARHWVIAHHLRTGHLPNNATFCAYPNSTGFNWGGGVNEPMHGKRVVMKLSIEGDDCHE